VDTKGEEKLGGDCVIHQTLVLSLDIVGLSDRSVPKSTGLFVTVLSLIFCEGIVEFKLVEDDFHA